MHLYIQKKSHPPQLLLITHANIIFELLLRTLIPVHTFFDENWFYRSIPKDDACCKEAVDDGEKYLYCVASENCTSKTHLPALHNLFHLGTSNAPMVSCACCSSPVGSVHVPTGLKVIFLLVESTLESLLHEPCSSIAVTRCDSDIWEDALLKFVFSTPRRALCNYRVCSLIAIAMFWF